MSEFHPSYDGLDRERLSALLEATFGKPLRPEFLMRPPLGVYVEQAYRGAAIVSPHATASFLTKFVVDRLAQGLGVGRDLWEAVTADHEKLFWRSRPQNPISRWYESQCQGMVRTPDWCVYFRGVEHNDIPRLIREALAAPVDFGP
jgi:acetylglutamate kinase